jgi:beta-glucosidase/6-phospho-beta-glucosidase/beta-galactosidase
VRFTLHWDQIARSRPVNPTDPADPAYDWTHATAVLAALHAQNIDVVLQLVGTPSWANGGKAANVIPTSAAPFGAFATAAATHYSWVRKWLVWNEPNQLLWLRPVSPALYVTRLLNPAYAAIHATIAGAEVAGGGTAPRGATGGV